MGVVAVRNFIVCLYRVNKDLLLSMLLLLLGLLLGPLVYLCGSTLPERSWSCLRVLLARGLLARFVRIALEWRLGNFAPAVSQLEAVVATLEDSISTQARGKKKTRGKQPEPSEQPRGKQPERSGQQGRAMVLQDLYTLLARMYLHRGHIDAALLLVVRVRKVLGIDRLPALPELDVRTAHLVRVSMAAGKLLDGNSLATLVVKTAMLEPQDGKSKQVPRGEHAGQRRDAKVIPFPSCNPR